MLPKYKQNKIIAAVLTVLLFAIVVVVLVAVVHYPPDPPIAERGVEVALGDSDNGLGDEPSLNNEQSAAAPQPQPSAEEHVATQTTEPTVPVTSSPVKTPTKTQPTQTTTQPTPKHPETPKEPEVNKNALFPGKKSGSATNAQSGGSSGNTSGSGNMGKPNGNPNSTNYNGDGGNGGGAVYSLGNRGVVNKGKPKDNHGVEGYIIVNIEVDQNGKVVKATVGKKTVMDSALQDEAVKAAYRTTFKPDPTAPDVQRGTIKYIYVNK